MEMKCMKTKRILSAAMALLLAVSLPMTALAEEYDLAKGSIEVTAKEDGNQYVSQTANNIKDAPQTTATVIIQTDSSTSATQHTVTITAKDKQTAEVTLSGVNIDVSGTGSGATGTPGTAAVSTSGAGNVTIKLDGENTVRSGYGSADLEKNNTGNLTITNADEDEDGSLTAQGGEDGAGIGGSRARGNDAGNITISGGTINAMGGEGGAGIGGGALGGDGSNITITGGEVKAQGGYGGAGIGGGLDGNGSDIIISGGEVTATGGLFGAGIGGGIGGSGSSITISDAEVNATGGEAGAGIGGGVNKCGSDITVSGDAQLKVQGGKEYRENGVNLGAGASIGNPGGYNGSVGAEVEPDVSELTAEGKIEYYAPGADMEKDAPIEDKTVIGKHEHQWVAGEVTKEPTCTETGVRIDTCISDETKSFTRTVELPLREHEFKDYVSDNNASYTQDGTKTAKCVWYDQCGKTHTVQDEGSRLIRSETAPLYRVKDADGRGVNYKAERKDGVLTVTVDADFAVLTGKLSGISALKVQGVEKIIFVTKGATSTFATADLLKQGAWGETYHLTHDGSTITFTLGEPPIDVSGILEKT